MLREILPLQRLSSEQIRSAQLTVADRAGEHTAELLDALGIGAVPEINDLTDVTVLAG